MIEMVRRAASAAALVAAAYLALASPAELVRVRPARPDAVDATPHGPDSLLPTRRTRAALPVLQVGGRDWNVAATALAADSPAATGAMARRRGVDPLDRELWFRVGERPVADVIGRTVGAPRRINVALEDGALLEVSTHPCCGGLSAPAPVAYPLRRLAPWTLLAGALCYLLIPWPPRPALAIRYARPFAVVVPDLMALLWVGAFGAAPWAIAGVSGAVGDFLALSAAMWLVGSLGLLMLWHSSGYARFRVDLAPDGLQMTGRTGSRRLAYADIERIETVTWRPPRWLRAIIWIGILFRRPGLMPVSQATRAAGDALVLVPRKGRRVRIWVDHLIGGSRLLEAARAAGVEVAPAAADLIAEMEN